MIMTIGESAFSIKKFSECLYRITTIKKLDLSLVEENMMWCSPEFLEMHERIPRRLSDAFFGKSTAWIAFYLGLATI